MAKTVRRAFVILAATSLGFPGCIFEDAEQKEDERVAQTSPAQAAAALAPDWTSEHLSEARQETTALPEPYSKR